RRPGQRLQLAHALGKRGLGHAHQPGGTSQAAELHGDAEGSQLRKVDSAQQVGHERILGPRARRHLSPAASLGGEIIRHRRCRFIPTGCSIDDKLPSEALTLALAASIYPPALAAVIALGRGREVQLRVVLFASAAYFTAFAIGVLVLVLFREAGATGKQVRTPTAALYIFGGVVLLVVAERLRGTQSAEEPKESTPSKTERYLESRWGVLLLAVILYVAPSPIFV